MKKLKLKALGLGAKEILTREQLKYVLGGSGVTGGGTGTGTGGGGGNTGGGSGGSAGWCTCVETYTSGAIATFPCSYSVQYCQDKYDSSCGNDDECVTVDCR